MEAQAHENANPNTKSLIVKEIQEKEANDSFTEMEKPENRHSTFLKKKFFARGHRFFDSGDYQVHILMTVHFKFWQRRPSFKPYRLIRF